MTNHGTAGPGAAENPAAETEHLAVHRQAILFRSALVGAATGIPLPGVGELLAEALQRGLLYHVAQLRYVDLDEAAVDAMLAGEEKKSRLGVLSAISGVASLLRRRKQLRRLFFGLAVLNALQEGSRAFHTATLFDHYCARYHTGAGVLSSEAQRLRSTIDQATEAAQRELASAVLEQIILQGTRLAQVAPPWIRAQINHQPDALPPLPALLAVAAEAKSSLRILSARRYLAQVVHKFDQKWNGSEGQRSETTN